MHEMHSELCVKITNLNNQKLFLHLAPPTVLLMFFFLYTNIEIDSSVFLRKIQKISDN